MSSRARSSRSGAVSGAPVHRASRTVIPHVAVPVLRLVLYVDSGHLPWKSARSRRWTGPRRSCRCSPGRPSGVPTTTSGTVPRRCSPRWRSLPAPVSRGTGTRSSSRSSNAGALVPKRRYRLLPEGAAGPRGRGPMTVGPGTSVDAVVGMRSVDMVPVPAQLKPIASEVHVNVYTRRTVPRERVSDGVEASGAVSSRIS
jgi:hypothetical protein